MIVVVDSHCFDIKLKNCMNTNLEWKLVGIKIELNHFIKIYMHFFIKSILEKNNSKIFSIINKHIYKLSIIVIYSN